jgi:hypothetical protein
MHGGPARQDQFRFVIAESGHVGIVANAPAICRITYTDLPPIVKPWPVSLR